MRTEGYEVGVTIPVQVGKGKMEKGKDNTQTTVKDPKTRNEEYGFLAVKAFDNVREQHKDEGPEIGE